VQTFEPVIQEEGRHILFFVNWVAWRRKQLNPIRRIAFDAKVIAVWVAIAWDRMRVGAGLNGRTRTPAISRDNNFTVTSAAAFGSELDVHEFMKLCLAENDRRLDAYDDRLVRPMMVPRLVRAFVAVLGLFSRRSREGLRPPMAAE
jgi:hypothetical protein